MTTPPKEQPRKTRFDRGRFAGRKPVRDRDLEVMDGPKNALEREADRILRDAERRGR